MPNLRNPYAIVGISILLIIIGIWLGKLFTNIPFIELDKKIDFAQVLNLIISIITLCIAFYIATILDRKKKKEEYAFDFYSKKINDIQLEVKQFLNFLKGEDLPIHLVNARIKSISLAYIDLKEIMSYLNMNIAQSEDQDILDVIQHIKRLSTEVPSFKFKTKIVEFVDEVELEINDGKLTFQTSRIDKIRGYTKTLINKTFYLVMK